MTEYPSEPKGVTAPSMKRIWYGWIVLAILFALMLTRALVSSTSSATSTARQELDSKTIFSDLVEPVGKSPEKLTDQDRANQAQMGLQLHLALSLRELSLDGSNDASTQQMIRQVADQVEIGSLENLVAARIYGAANTELKRPIKAKYLAPLQKSKDPHDQALAKLYAAPEKLSRPEAEALVKQLDGSTFLMKLARVQALEKAGDKEIRHKTFDYHFAIDFVLLILLVGTVLVGSFLVWAVLLYKKNKGQLVPLGPPIQAQTLLEADGLAVRAAWLLVLFSVVGIVTAPFGAAAPYFAAVPMLLAIPLLSRMKVGGRSYNPGDLGITFRRFGRDVLWGIAGFFAEIPVTLVAAAVGSMIFWFLPEPTHPAAQELTNATSIGAILPVLFFGSILAPIWEEFMFRGLLFPALSRVSKSLVKGAVASSFMFAMIHPQGAVLWFALASVACFGCALTYQRKSLVSSIVMHMLHNTATFWLALLVTGKI